MPFDNSSRSPRRIAAALLLGSVLGAGGAALALSGESLAASTPPITVVPTNPQPGFSTLVTRVKPAVVQIATISSPSARQGAEAGPSQQMPDLQGPFGDMLRRYFGQRGQGGMQLQRPEQRAMGSGFIINPAGYIVTN